MVETSLKTDRIWSPGRPHGCNELIYTCSPIPGRNISRDKLLLHPSLAQTCNSATTAQLVERGKAASKNNRHVEGSVNDTRAQLDALGPGRDISKRFDGLISRGVILRESNGLSV